MKAIINARIYDYVNYIENGYILYDEEIIEVGDMKNFKNSNYEKVEDFSGDLLLPTFVCAHSHIYSIFARGLSLPFNPKNFQDILDQMWWKLDSKLTNKETYYSALCAGEEFLLNGVTSVIDHHASGEIKGSLKELRKAFANSLKMRGIFCFETSDRFDVKSCINENISFAKKYPKEGLFGMHASMSISDKTLKNIAKIQNNVPIHVHVSESAIDEEDSNAKYKKSIIKRFDDAKILIPDSLIVHGVYLNDEELDIISKNKCYIVVNTTSNMNNAVGLPNVKSYLNHNIPVMVGNDGLSSSMANEYLNVLFTSHLKSNSPIALGVNDVKKMIINSYEYVGRRLGIKLGQFQPGFVSDFMRVHYTPFTKIDCSNILGHIMFGLFPSFKPSDVYTYGKKRVKNYAIVSKVLTNQIIEAKKYSSELWLKLLGGK